MKKGYTYCMGTLHWNGREREIEIETLTKGGAGRQLDK